MHVGVRLYDGRQRETKVTDGRLVIRATRSIRPVQPLIIKVTASDLTAIMLGGAGGIAITGIANDNLRATLRCTPLSRQFLNKFKVEKLSLTGN
jgi:hypothetical protein